MQIFSYVCREQIEFAYLFYGTYKVPVFKPTKMVWVLFGFYHCYLFIGSIE